LIDKDGKIVWTGSPSAFDIESAIDKLLERKKVEEENLEEEEEEEEGEVINGKLWGEFTDAERDEIINKIVKSEYGLILGWKSSTGMIASHSNPLKHVANLVVYGAIPNGCKKQFDQFLKELGVKDVQNYVGESNKTGSIKKGSKCSGRGKEIGKDEISFESFQTKEGTDGESEVTACEKCEEKFKDKHLFFYVPKNATLIGLLFGREKFTFGVRKISTTPSNADNKVVHLGVGCDGCSGRVPGIRWKCAHCDNWDYCENCMKTKTHPAPNHVFVKIDYPGKMVQHSEQAAPKKSEERKRKKQRTKI